MNRTSIFKIDNYNILFCYECYESFFYRQCSSGNFKSDICSQTPCVHHDCFLNNKTPTDRQKPFMVKRCIHTVQDSDTAFQKPCSGTAASVAV